MSNKNHPKYYHTSKSKRLHYFLCLGMESLFCLISAAYAVIAWTQITLLRWKDCFVDQSTGDRGYVSADDIVAQQSDKEAEEPGESVNLVDH